MALSNNIGKTTGARVRGDVLRGDPAFALAFDSGVNPLRPWLRRHTGWSPRRRAGGIGPVGHRAVGSIRGFDTGINPIPVLRRATTFGRVATVGGFGLLWPCIVLIDAALR